MRQVAFVNPWVDGLAIGGLSLLLLIPLALLPLGKNPNLLLLFLALTNWPHLIFIFVSLYREPLPRRLRYGAPVILSTLALLSLLYPESIGRAFITCGAIWNLYHIAAQAYGVTLVYARREGIALERSALSWVLYGTLCFAILRFPQFALSREQGLRFVDEWRFPAVLYVALAVLAHWQGRAFWRAVWRSPTSLFALPTIAFVAWCFTPGTAFFLYLGAFHGLQYLIFAWARSGRYSRHPGRWWAGLLAAGVGLQLVLRSSGAAFAIWLTAVNCFHFLADGALWKIRRAPALLS